METAAYTPNGNIASASDANGNRTSYEYDGHDRLAITRYPVMAKGAQASSGADYEQSVFDANNNVTSRRLRDGQVLHYGYDALNRRVFDDNPNTNVAEVDVSYSYDNLGRLLRAGDQHGWFAGFDYDALGRVTRQFSNVSSNALQYDTAGRLTRQTWSDGFFVTYDHRVTGEMAAVRENGGFVLATYGYDSLGRRTSITRGNGTVTTYGYDAASRLASLDQDLAGGAHDLALTYGYNPAGQIAARTSSNDIYSFNQLFNVDRPYASNGLNQYTQSGAVAPTYDARGNLTSAGGSASYAYDTRNQLFTNNLGQLFYRNPAGLLNHVIANGKVTNLDYVGANLATEFDGMTGQVLRRYVHGPAADEPLVWYEEGGTGHRRWLHADERGSVVAVTDGSGQALVINRYDEYGIPGSGNLGRFQYTGQKWIPELGMYDYKARMYSPTLGRFMQTDPIGYGDGLNWYDYVGGDPVNNVDPTGLCDGEGDSPEEEAADCRIEINLLNTSGGGGGGGGGGGLGGGYGGGAVGGEVLPPPQNGKDESLLQCVANNLDAGGLTGAVFGGAAAIGAGAPLVSKLSLTGKSGTLSGGANPSGARTSVLSAAARGLIGQGPKLEPGGFLARLTNTGKVATAVGRIASTASVVVGVGLEAIAIGEVALETYRCSNK